MAVLGDALQIYHLLEGQCRRLTLQDSVPFCPPRALHPQFPLDHSFTGKQLYLCHTGVAGNVQHGSRGLCKDQLALQGDQLIQHSHAAYTLQGTQLLLNAAICQCRDDLGLALGVHRDHQPVSPTHLDAARVCRAGVEVLCLPFYHSCPCRKGQLRQFQLPGKGQLLLGLAQAFFCFTLVKHCAAQVAL